MRAPPVITIQPPQSASSSNRESPLEFSIADHHQDEDVASWNYHGERKTIADEDKSEVLNTPTVLTQDSSDIIQEIQDIQWNPTDYHIRNLNAKFIGLINHQKFRFINLISLCYILLNFLLLGTFFYQISEPKQDKSGNLVENITANHVICEIHPYDKLFQSLIHDDPTSTNYHQFWIILSLISLIMIVAQTILILLVNQDYFIDLYMEKDHLDVRSSDDIIGDPGRPRTHRKWIHKLALLISLTLLHMIMDCLTNLEIILNDNSDQMSFLSLIAEYRPRIGANLSLAYITPMLLDSANSILVNAIGLALLAPTFCVSLKCLIWVQLDFDKTDILTKVDQTSYKVIDNISEQIKSELIFEIILMPCALAIGWFHRMQIKSSICEKIFADANELIEAKVGLEAQRQQQETLLLSVLPAYVAEQVKRNMLKKVDRSRASQDHTIPSSQINFSQPSQLQSAVIVRRSSTSGQPVTELVGSNLNLTLPSQAERPASYLGRRKSSFSEHGFNKHNCKIPRSSSIQTTQLPIGSTKTQNGTNFGQTLTTSSHLHSSSTSNTPIQQSIPSTPVRKGFNELFIRTYNNVSLLYGDIVGFTYLCTKLSASHLVRVLNNLFSQFDHLAEHHKIMRIKILGDCYYGVSGIPEFAVLGAKSRINLRNENHAINCVNMGLDMIDYIACLNRELASNRADQLLSQSNSANTPNNPNGSPMMEQIELNMRIGIHSGHIHSGIIGLKKWQFDVWSNDVSIAMHCESSGTPGRVQVTEATIAHLKQAFIFEPSEAGNLDTFLDGQNISTYFIIERNNKQRAGLASSGSCNKRRHHHNKSRRSLLSWSRPHSPDNDLDEKIRAATINTIHQTLLSVDIFTTDPNNSVQRPALNYHNMTKFNLDFKDPVMTRLHASRPITGLGNKIFCLWVLLAFIIPAVGWYLGSVMSLLPENPISQSIFISISFFIIYLPQNLNCLSCSTSSSSSTSSTGNQNKSKYSHLMKLLNLCRHNLNLRRDVKFTSGNGGTCSRAALNNGNGNGQPRISQLRQGFTAGLILFIVIIQFNQLIWSVYGQCVQSSRAGRANPLMQSFRLQQIQGTILPYIIAINFSSNLLRHSHHLGLLFILALVALISLPVWPNFMLLNLASSSCDDCPDLTPHSDSFLLIDCLSGFLVIIAIVWSTFCSRQVEFADKANFLWRNQLSVDHEELEYISGINKILLENILPSHVVQYYLNQQQQPQQPVHTTRRTKKNSKDPHSRFKFGRGEADPFRMSFTSIRSLNNHHELYHESHQGVAVMFASIPHFYEFYDETDVSKQGLGCIALLNEIICDFDKLLLKNKFSRIEKIKTIGSTYMAVAGLRPQHHMGTMSARNSNASQSSMAASETMSVMDVIDHGHITTTTTIGDTLGKFLSSQQKQNLLCMVQFATSLMQALNNINKQSFQAFKLRVGLNSGSVIAGVIGAQRPFYDIWGDTVNIASRMESLGHIGRIQVPELAANILMDTTGIENSYRIIKRGAIQVKGKGGMVTYFVDKRDKPPTSSMQITSTTTKDEDLHCVQ